VSNDNVTKLIQPEAFEDALTEVLRNGARALLAQAIEAEVAEFLDKHRDLRTEDGRQRVVRHGHLPEREGDDGHRAGCRQAATCPRPGSRCQR
jgi:putative transposase